MVRTLLFEKDQFQPVGSVNYLQTIVSSLARQMALKVRLRSSERIRIDFMILWNVKSQNMLQKMHLWQNNQYIKTLSSYGIRHNTLLYYTIIITCACV